jgi:TonB-dependent starch-binding outer membrane protein SusC
MRSTWKALVLMVAVAGTAAAQTTGTISGRVTDRTSGTAVPEANVSIVGTVQGARTNDEGRYRIVGARPGTHQVRVTRLGYGVETRSVTVTAGAETTLDFAIAASAARIDEVVVTATGETQLKRESGNVVSTVSTTPENLANATTIASLLTGKAPGVFVGSSGGTTGSASKVRIRGANSVSLTNEPLLIIDGVRVNNDISGTGNIGVGGQVPSRLNDLNPDDIETFEVIKGPAAAALYGTAAANGVLQIRTRHGRAGRTRWTVYSEAGSQEDQTDYPANFARVDTSTAASLTARGLVRVICTLDSQTRGTCVPNAVDSVSRFNPLEQASPFITGYRSSVGVNAAGGSDVANYYLSADVDHDQGVYEPNRFKRASIRANLSGQLRSNVTTQFFTNYASSRLEFPQNDNNILGVVSSGLLGSAFDNTATRGYLSGQTPAEVFAIDTRENVERFIGSNQTTWQALPWLATTLQAGVDFLDKRNKDFTAPGKVFFNSSTIEGSRTSNAAQIWNYTANFSGTASKDINVDMRSTSTLGVQFNREVVQGTRAFGAKLLAGTGSLQGTSARFAVGETNTDNRTLGALFQQQLAWKDRLFATAAVRTDNNSAFGANAGWVYYPAASISYVISDESFFPRGEVLSSLRLRTAYGESGQRPSFRDAISFLSTQTVTTAAGDNPGIIVGGTGNLALKPEKSREIEVGFEVGFWNDRVNVDFTSYDKRTNDLLIAKPLPPSLGLTTTQFDNIGTSSNKGIELQVSGRVFEFTNARLEANVSAATNRNRLVSSGGQPPIVVGIQRHVAGYPLGGYWDEQYIYEDKNGDGIISRLNCPGQTALRGGPDCEILVQPLSYLGNPLPTKEASFAPRLTLYKYFELGALLDYRGGFKQFNNTARFRCNFGNCEESYDKTESLFLQARNIAHLLATDAGYIEDSDYTKLREVTLSILAPREIANRVRAGEVRLTLAGRNLKTWTNYTGFDPEVNSTPSANFSQSDFLTQPPLRIYSARLTMSF